MRRAHRLCHYSLDLSSSPKTSVKIPFCTLHITRIQPGLLWKTAFKSRVPHNTDQALVGKWVGTANLVLQIFNFSVHINCSFPAAHTCTGMYWWQPSPSGNICYYRSCVFCFPIFHQILKWLFFYSCALYCLWVQFILFMLLLYCLYRILYWLLESS